MSTEFEGTLLVFLGGTGGKHDNFHVAEFGVDVYDTEQVKAIHVWHFHVEQTYVGWILCEQV